MTAIVKNYNLCNEKKQNCLNDIGGSEGEEIEGGSEGEEIERGRELLKGLQWREVVERVKERVQNYNLDKFGHHNTHAHIHSTPTKTN